MDGILEIYTFGGMHFRGDRDGDVTFRTSKGAALAVYLACTGQVHPREVLAEMFWPERSLDVARSNLRAALTDLRKQAGSAAQVSRKTVSLLPGTKCWVDAIALEEGLNRIDESDPESGLTPSARALLQETLVIYQGDFLSGVYINSPDFEHWAWMERERLRNRVMSAFDVLIDYHILHTEYVAGLSRASALLQIDPLREQTIRYLMQLHAQSGDRVSALHQYESWRAKLNDELGLEPEAQTVTLYEDIKRGRLSPSPSITVLGGSVIRIDNVQLPHPPTLFVGREHELAALVNILTSPGARLITILGPGGIGKTRLAIAVVHAVSSATEAASHYTDGIIFVPLEAVPSSRALLRTVTSTIGLPPTASRAQLLDYLGSRKLLIILDNFEPFLSEASLLHEMLDAAPGLRLLVTSREPVSVYGEHRFPILGLALPEHDALIGDDQVLMASPGVSLFVQSARRSNPHLVFSGDELRTAIAICRMLDGIPLAIELAASWTRLLPLAEIREEIRRSIDFLETDLQDVPERHRNMRGVFESVWERLPEEEQTIFAELAVFTGGFSREAAQGVTGCSMRVLASLVSKSLVHYDLEMDRYRIHELLRQFCAQKRADVPGWDFAACDRHSAFFCYWLKGHERDLFSGPQEEALASIEREAGNVFAAWYWAAEHHDATRLLSACASIGHLSNMLGQLDDGWAALGAVIGWLRGVAQLTSTQQYLLAMALHWQALLGRHLHKPNNILRQTFLRANEIWDNFPPDAPGPRNQKAWTLMQLVHLSHPNEVRKLQEQSLALFRKTGDRLGEAFVLWAIGIVALRANDFVTAEQELAQCLALCQSTEAAGSHIAIFADGLTWALYAQNKFAEAGRLADSLLASYQRPGHPVLTAQGMYAAARLLVYQGRFSEAYALAEESLLIFEQRRLRHLISPALVLQARCSLHLGQYINARIEAEAALRPEKILDYKIVTSHALNVLSRVALVQGDLAQAHELADHRIVFPFYYTRHRHEGFRLAVGAYALLLLDQALSARRQITEALKIAVSGYDYFVLVHALPAVALLYAVEGDCEAAVETYSLATQQPFVGKSAWFEAVVGTRIHAAASSNLPASAIESAEVRGRGRDLWETSAAVHTELS